MNIFALSAGRCGSLTFARACAHIANYSSGHETRIGCIGGDRLDYPPDHIEADNRLSWFLGRLECKYGSDARFVHLTRSPEKIARSYAKRTRTPDGIIPAYMGGIYMNANSKEPYQAAIDYVSTVEANIRLFLRYQPGEHVEINLDQNPAVSFARFWDSIGAEGNKAAAVAEYETPHNSSSLQDAGIFRRIAHKLGVGPR